MKIFKICLALLKIQKMHIKFIKIKAILYERKLNYER